MFDIIMSQLQELLSDAKALGKVRLELLQLNLVDQAIPKLVRGIYALGIFSLLSLLLFLALITGGFATSLLFAPEEASPFMTLQALTYGFLCLWGVLLFFTFIIIAVRRPLIRRFEATAYKSYLEKLDKKQIR